MHGYYVHIKVRTTLTSFGLFLLLFLCLVRWLRPMRTKVSRLKSLKTEYRTKVCIFDPSDLDHTIRRYSQQRKPKPKQTHVNASLTMVRCTTSKPKQPERRRNTLATLECCFSFFCLFRDLSAWCGDFVHRHQGLSTKESRDWISHEGVHLRSFGSRSHHSSIFTPK